MKKDEDLSLEEQVERIRQKRSRHGDRENIRRILNTAFLTLAAIGLVWYYTNDSHRMTALAIIAVGMLLKVVEFFIRFMG